MISSAIDFFADLGRKIGLSSGKNKEGRFVSQRIYIALQRCNVILLHESFVGVDDPDL